MPIFVAFRYHSELQYLRKNLIISQRHFQLCLRRKHVFGISFLETSRFWEAELLAHAMLRDYICNWKKSLRFTDLSNKGDCWACQLPQANFSIKKLQKYGYPGLEERLKGGTWKRQQERKHSPAHFSKPRTDCRYRNCAQVTGCSKDLKFDSGSWMWRFVKVRSSSLQRSNSDGECLPHIKHPQVAVPS